MVLSDILFENRALHQPQDRHPDHRRRVSGGDGHPRAKTQVKIGRSQNDRHDQADQHRAERELPHVGLLGHVRLELLSGCGRSHASRDLTFSLIDLPSTILPFSLACAAFITTPICLTEVTPVSARASAMADSISASPAAAGR